MSPRSLSPNRSDALIACAVLQGQGADGSFGDCPHSFLTSSGCICNYVARH